MIPKKSIDDVLIATLPKSVDVIFNLASCVNRVFGGLESLPCQLVENLSFAFALPVLNVLIQKPSVLQQKRQQLRNLS